MTDTYNAVQMIKGLVALAALVFTLVSTWVVGLRARARMKRVLGRSAKNEVELTSLNSWMQVKDEEERRMGGKLG